MNTAIVLALFGIVLIFTLSVLFGLILLVSSIPVYLRVSKLRARENQTKNRILKITPKEIIVIYKVETINISRELITKLDYKTDKNKNLSFGIISAKLEDNRSFEILEIFGDDKRYVEDDAKIIVDAISQIVK